MDIKKRIQELSLDQKAKLYFMALLQKGEIDKLPDDPKAAYVRMMMNKDDYGRSISGKDKRTFMEPEDSMPAARARKLSGMEDDPRMDPAIRSDFDDPMFENYTKQSLLKALGNADDALIQTHVSPGEKGEGDYDLDGQEYVIYNPNSNNDDNATMWNSDDYVVALDKDGEEYEIAYADIMRINLEETRDEEDEENERNLALDDIPVSLRELSTELGYLNEQDDNDEDLRLEPEDMDNPDEDLVIIGSGYVDIKSNFLSKTFPSMTNDEYAALGQKVVDQLHNGDKEAALKYIYSRINENINESKVNISYTDPGFRFYKMKVDGKRLNREEGTKYLKGLGIDMEIPRSYDESILDKIVAQLKEKGIDADHDAAMDVS